MPKRVVKDPGTDEEWQVAADGCYGALVLDSARMYGLVVGGPEVNADRCEDLLAKAKARGITPRPDAIERFIDAMNRPRCRGASGGA